MDPWKNWTRCSLLWVLCCYYLFLLTAASPLPLNQTGTLNNRSCSLSRHHFKKFAFKNMTYTVAREARVNDKDTVNRFVGQDLYINITRSERCYLMKRVTDTVTHVLHDLKNPNPNFHEKPMEDTTYIEGNLKRMKDKLKQYDGKQYQSKVIILVMANATAASLCNIWGSIFLNLMQLGDNGMNKMVGELDLLYDYLRDVCTSKKASSKHQDKKNSG